ncbi:NAD(P)/FAD-dependent oxidoreductase [Nitriliruptoraceae bacterium ZYF776]|nr:NAD(P)/FAD-dependent oxidoreductase [Profundirhabdus halotolerans]
MPDQLPTDVDVVVVGGGPAGLAAATWLGRYRRRTLVVDAGEPRNATTWRIHGLLGHDPISPSELRTASLRGLDAYPHVDRVAGEVVTATGSEGDFHVSLDGGAHVRARRVVLATGVRDRLPDVAGLADHYGADVFHCPACDGFETAGQRVAVLGWGAHVPAFATELLDWAASVTVVSDGPPSAVTAEQHAGLGELGIRSLDDPAVELLGERGALRGVRLRSGAVLEVDTAFFSLGHEVRDDLAVQLGCTLTDEGVVAVDRDQRTSVPGVFAAGDLTPGTQLVAIAVGEGTAAGVAAARSLHGHTTVPGAPPPAPSPGPVAPG